MNELAEKFSSDSGFHLVFEIYPFKAGGRGGGKGVIGNFSEYSFDEWVIMNELLMDELLIKTYLSIKKDDFAESRFFVR